MIFGFIHRLIQRGSFWLAGDSSVDFSQDITYTNIMREKTFSTLILLLMAPCFMIDYKNLEAGYWITMPGYRYLFYMHVIGAAAMLIFIVLLRIRKIHSPLNINAWHKALSFLFILFILVWCTIISVVDQLIHRDLTVYIIGMFAAASTIYMNNRTSIIIYFTPWALLLYCLPLYQPDPHRLKGFAINATAVMAIAWLLSRIFYAAYLRDFNNRKIIENQKEILMRQSKEDFLTGLYNRRYLNLLLSQEFSRARRHNLHLTVAMGDIDFFKSINDTYSHGIGDEVLRTIADIFRKSLRSFDIIARYGGEEFVIILPETDLAEALVVCERIRVTVENYDWEEIQAGLAVTISFGITDDMSLENYEKMLSLADEKLYIAKKSGRNTVRY